MSERRGGGGWGDKLLRFVFFSLFCASRAVVVTYSRTDRQPIVTWLVDANVRTAEESNDRENAVWSL